MDAQKEKKLNETYNKFIQVSLYDLPLEAAKEFVAENIMGYGTHKDERIFSFSEYGNLITRQREQAADVEMHVDVKPVYRKISTRRRHRDYRRGSRTLPL